MTAIRFQGVAEIFACLLCTQLMESAQLTDDQKAELQRQRQEYLRKVAELASARAPYKVSKCTVCTTAADVVVL